MGFHHVGQAGLELLTSSNPPVLASQSVKITGVSHRTWPYTFITITYLLKCLVACNWKGHPHLIDEVYGNGIELVLFLYLGNQLWNYRSHILSM